MTPPSNVEPPVLEGTPPPWSAGDARVEMLSRRMKKVLVQLQKGTALFSSSTRSGSAAANNCRRCARRNDRRSWSEAARLKYTSHVCPRVIPMDPEDSTRDARDACPLLLEQLCAPHLASVRQSSADAGESFFDSMRVGCCGRQCDDSHLGQERRSEHS